MIELQNVSKLYRGGVHALKNISLKIEDGEFVYLTGMSGSGKSTLMKLLYREEKATRGHIRVGNRVITKLKNRDIHELRREVGVVFQDFQLLPTRTVFENVAYALEVIETEPAEIRTRVMEALRVVGLEEKAEAFPSECSGGEQQRVAIARAIVNAPKVLLADEPTGNLDPAAAMEIMRLFYRINQRGTTVVMATHNQKIIRQIPFRVIELVNGELKRDRTQNHISLLYSAKMGEYFVV
ncbi:cell division ATP-binding protein FtsE [Atopococcus tabaci]|uniref:cell division ATP-binding protein FtsE n=1 Tax=Atopococcus tabaci TaxID=269774 RepID=UPI00041B562E|nr:cell division ATP-binding protein FtsE [Atopococcus tabaci]